MLPARLVSERACPKVQTFPWTSDPRVSVSTTKSHHCSSFFAGTRVTKAPRATVPCTEGLKAASVQDDLWVNLSILWGKRCKQESQEGFRCITSSTSVTRVVVRVSAELLYRTPSARFNLLRRLRDSVRDFLMWTASALTKRVSFLHTAQVGAAATTTSWIPLTNAEFNSP